MTKATLSKSRRPTGRPLQRSDLPSGAALADVSASTFDDLMRAVEEIRMTRGEAAPFVTGFLLSGVIGVADQASDGRQMLSALFHAGELIDLRRDARPPQGRPVALTDARVIVFNPSRMDAALRAHPDLAAVWLSELREQAAALRDHCGDLNCKTPVERLAAALLEFRRWPQEAARKDVLNANGAAPSETSAEAAEGQDVANSAATVLKLPILRNHIAEYIGVQPETVSRAFRTLESERIIEIERKDTIRLCDLPAIRTIANGGRPRAGAR